MADRKISDLTALTTPASGDYLPIVDISEGAAASKNKRVTIQNLFQGIPVNVGIGTNSPWTSGVLDCFGRAKFGASSTNGLYLGIVSGTPNIQGFNTADPSSSALAFYAGYDEAMRIDFSGNVGIGTASPGVRLQVNAPSTGRSYSSSVLDFSTIHLDGITANSTTSALTFSSGGGGGAAIAFSRGGSFATEISFWTCSTLSANSATERLRIDSAGRVGIGTTAPTTLLDVNTDTVRVRTARTPASASATGATGEICWDANYIYVCTATNTWRRSAISSW